MKTKKAFIYNLVICGLVIFTFYGYFYDINKLGRFLEAHKYLGYVFGLLCWGFYKQIKECPFCQKILPPNAKVCRHCNHDLTSVPHSVPVKPLPAFKGLLEFVLSSLVVLFLIMGIIIKLQLLHDNDTKTSPVTTQTSQPAPIMSVTAAQTDLNWRCVVGVNVPIALTATGDVACMSYNQRDCLWSNTCENILATALRIRLQPVICGEMHRAIFGSEGYDNPNHWCQKGRLAIGK